MDAQRIVSEDIATLAAPVAARLAAHYDFTRHRRVLDLGGGTSNFLLAVLDRHAGLEATLHKLPVTAAVVCRHLAGTPEAARIKIVEGDFFKDPIPKGADIVIIANVVDMLYPAQNLDVFRRTRRCAPAVPGCCWWDSGPTPRTLSRLLKNRVQVHPSCSR